MSRVRQFMERYARAGGDGSLQQTDLRRQSLARHVRHPPRWKLLLRPLARSQRRGVATTRQPRPALNPLVCETNGHCGEHEPEAVVIVEVTNDAPAGQAPGTPSSDEILFIE